MPLPPPRLPLGPLVPLRTTPILAPRAPAAVAPAERLAQLIEALHALRESMNRHVHRSGTVLRELATPAMLTAARVTDFEALLAKFDLPPRVVAMKYMAVAEHFTEEEAARVGVERGYAIVLGAARLPEPIAPQALLARNPTITVGNESARLMAAPVRTVTEWVRTLRTPTAAAPTKKAYREADAARDRLRRKLGTVGIGEPKMRVARRGADYVVRVELDPAMAVALARLLKLP